MAQIQRLLSMEYGVWSILTVSIVGEGGKQRLKKKSGGKLGDFCCSNGNIVSKLCVVNSMIFFFVLRRHEGGLRSMRGRTGISPDDG